MGNVCTIISVVSSDSGPDLVGVAMGSSGLDAIKLPRFSFFLIWSLLTTMGTCSCDGLSINTIELCLTPGNTSFNLSTKAVTWYSMCFSSSSFEGVGVFRGGLDSTTGVVAFDNSWFNFFCCSRAWIKSPRCSLIPTSSWFLVMIHSAWNVFFLPFA